MLVTFGTYTMAGAILISYYYYGSTNVWMRRVENNSVGWVANRNRAQHQLKAVVTITQWFAQTNLGKNGLIKVS